MTFYLLNPSAARVISVCIVDEVFHEIFRGYGSSHRDCILGNLQRRTSSLLK